MQRLKQTLYFLAFYLLLNLLLTSQIAAQETSLWQPLQAAGGLDNWLASVPGPHAVLLGASATDSDADQAMLRRHTGSLILLDSAGGDVTVALACDSAGPTPDCSETRSTALIGNYAALQHILQQRELLFWQLPLWMVVINLLSALVLLLVSFKQADLPLFRWLLACALTGNSYFLPHLLPQLIPGWLSWAGIVLWLYFLYRLVRASLPQAATDSPQDRASGYLRYSVALLAALFLIDGIIMLLDINLAAHPGRHVQLVPAGQLLGILAALYFLVSRHAETASELEQLNTSLDQRVRSASAELQARYTQLKKDALDAASMKERKHIYQSIHEDLSDKLLQLIYSANSPETADLARAALSELRDSRHLLPDQQRPLDDVLADARSEIQIRCDQAGLALVWRQQPADYPVYLSARQCSALSRTLREAVSNLLKHARAKTAEISISVLADATLVYCVQDDGIGAGSQSRPGRGLINMQNRIRELGGSLNISHVLSGGTRLEFRLPLTAGGSELLS